MESQSDHDLLITLSTKMDMILSGQQMYMEAWSKLIERVTALEIQEGIRDTEIKNLEEEIADLQKKSSFADNVNMAVTAIASIVAGTIGYFFGPR